MDARCRQGASAGEGAPRWVGVDQLLSGDGSSRPARRLQDERVRPRIRHPANGRVPQPQGCLDQDGLAGRAPPIGTAASSVKPLSLICGWSLVRRSQKRFRIIHRYTLGRRRRRMPNPKRPADNNASVDGSGTTSGPSTASDWALTAKLTRPIPGNVTEKPAGVRSCKVPSSRIFGRVRPCGVGIPLSGLVCGSDRNVAKNPTVAPFDTKLSSSRTSLTPPPPPSIVMVPWLVIAIFRSNVLRPITLPTLRLADSILVAIVAPAMSVFTTIGAMPAGSSLNEIDAALAGPVPTKETVVIPSENIPSAAPLGRNLNFWVICTLH